MHNWHALGEPKKAATSKKWFYANLGLLPLQIWLGFLFLLVWYFSFGRKQSKYVKEKFGKSYPKKPWGKVIR